jgi:hypothetical protein
MNAHRNADHKIILTGNIVENSLAETYYFISKVKNIYSFL